MDPFLCILPEIHDLVLQHFDEDDFLEGTEVSPDWNEMLGSTQEMMGKVKLRLVNEIENPENVIENVSRRYQNVYMFLDDVHTEKNRSSLLLQHLVALGPSLVNLKVESFADLSAENEKILDKLELPQLKDFEFFFVCDEVESMLLNRCNSLTRLTTFHISPFEDSSSGSLPSMISFLERNQGLESLNLCRDYYDALFENDISDITRSQLKSIRIKNASVSLGPPEFVERNLIKFLVKQSKSLETLDIDDCRSNVIEHIFNMSALKCFKIREKFSTRFLRLNLNEHITELDIKNIEDPEDFRKILQTVPNLTKLSFSAVNRVKVEIIAPNLPALQSLRFDYLGDIKVRDIIWRLLWPKAVPIFKNDGYEWTVERPLSCEDSDDEDD